MFFILFWARGNDDINLMKYEKGVQNINGNMQYSTSFGAHYIFAYYGIKAVILSYKLGPFGVWGAEQFFCHRRFQTFNGNPYQ